MCSTPCTSPRPASARAVQRAPALLRLGADRLRARPWSLLTAFNKHAELLTAYRAQDCLFVHAGVVGWQGKAILIPGRSFSGKTTLVKALIEAGATYYSDEFAILDRQGLVHPYPLPLRSAWDGAGHAGNSRLRHSAGRWESRHFRWGWWW